MDSNEFLQAIGGLIDEKLKPVFDKVTSVDGKVTSLEKDVKEIKQDITGLKHDMTEVKQDITGLKQDMTEVKKLATRTAIIQENDISKKLQLIYENQISIIESNKRLDKQDADIDDLQTDVFTLKHAFGELKKAT